MLANARLRKQSSVANKEQMFCVMFKPSNHYPMINGLPSWYKLRLVSSLIYISIFVVILGRFVAVARRTLHHKRLIGSAYMQIMFSFRYILHWADEGGDIKIFRKEDLQSFKLIAEATDPNPIPVEYISFGSYNANLVKFYFNCSFSFSTPDTISTATDHPLLARDVTSTIDLRNCNC